MNVRSSFTECHFILKASPHARNASKSGLSGDAIGALAILCKTLQLSFEEAARASSTQVLAVASDAIHAVKKPRGSLRIDLGDVLDRLAQFFTWHMFVAASIICMRLFPRTLGFVGGELFTPYPRLLNPSWNLRQRAITLAARRPMAPNVLEASICFGIKGL